MEEKSLTKLCLVIGLIGVLGLYVFLDGFYDEVVLEEGEIREFGFDGGLVFGKVNRIYSRNGTTYLNVLRQKWEEVDIVVFDDVNLGNVSYVRVKGRWHDWMGKRVLVADEVYQS